MNMYHIELLALVYRVCVLNICVSSLKIKTTTYVMINNSLTGQVSLFMYMYKPLFMAHL